MIWRLSNPDSQWVNNLLSSCLRKEPCQPSLSTIITVFWQGPKYNCMYKVLSESLKRVLQTKLITRKGTLSSFLTSCTWLCERRNIKRYHKLWIGYPDVLHGSGFIPLHCCPNESFKGCGGVPQRCLQRMVSPWVEPCGLWDDTCLLILLYFCSRW